jgi:hypothetical protein
MKLTMKVDINLLRNICIYPSDKEYREKLYDNLVDMPWWSNEQITNDTERQKFLYEAFIEYYNIINNGEIRETEKDEDQKEHRRYLLINLCKTQLEKELERVNNKDYIKYNED